METRRTEEWTGLFLRSVVNYVVHYCIHAVFMGTNVCVCTWRERLVCVHECTHVVDKCA